MNIKHLLACATIPVVLSLGGCNNANIQSAVEAAANNLMKGSMPKGQGGKVASTSYTMANEKIFVTDAKRSSRDYGAIQVKTEKNPQGLTIAKLISVSQSDSGGEFRSGHARLFKLSPEGWLAEQDVYINKASSPTALRSGKYYLKGTDRSQDFYATGEITITRGVTNLISIAVE